MQSEPKDPEYLEGLTYAEVGVRKDFEREESQEEGSVAGVEARHRERHGRRGERRGTGPDESCVCLSCGEKVLHERGVPCRSVKCPKCGNFMIRKTLKQTARLCLLEPQCANE
jgi:predicted RNA-binding Zn-ribbon protein involved in translation (DUF1610 family)